MYRKGTTLHTLFRHDAGGAAAAERLCRLDESPQRLLQAADVVVDKALLPEVLRVRYANEGQHCVDLLEVQNLIVKNYP